MHRQIRKFKVWDKNYNGWATNGNLGHIMSEFSCLEHCLDEFFNCEELIFQQFTGLTDSKGKEIYEGDIIQRSNQWDIEERAIVIFDPPRFSAPMNNGFNLLNFNDIQVIGNICQNPGLV